MNEKLHLYTIINHPIFSEGIENIVCTSTSSEIRVVRKKSLDELMSVKNIIKKDYSQILIYDLIKFSTKEINSLSQLINKNPQLKVIIIASILNTSYLKSLLQIGVVGIINKNILREQFVDYLNKILKNEKVISHDYWSLIVESFLNSTKTKIDREEIAYFSNLSNREKEILKHICDGKNSREIAEDLFLSLHTVETHRRKILQKLGAKNTASMVKAAIRYNLCS